MIIGQGSAIDLANRLAANCAPAVMPSTMPANANGNHGTSPKLDVPRWLASHGIEFREKRLTDGRTSYLIACPFDPNHGANGETAIFQSPDGKLGANCKHISCQGKGWQEFKAAIGFPAAEHWDRPLANCGQKPAQVSTVDTTTTKDAESRPLKTYRKITSAELAMGDYAQEYLIPGVLVAKQPCIIGAPHKAMKTSTMIDAAIALDTGGYFFGYFKVARRATVGVMSGESGLSTIQETAKRVCKAAGLRLEDRGITWSDELPRFGDPVHLDAIEDFIQGIEVLMVDPAYLCMPSGNEGSVFAQGELLRSVSELCQKHGTALMLAHHLRKNRMDAHAPPTLDEIAWAGFAEFARQWWLLGRREPYEVGSGNHKLWLSVGGSAGHNGLYGIDIAEGTQADDGGRRWEVEVRGVRDTAAEQKRAKETKAARAKEESAKQNEEKLRAALLQFPNGETATVLKDTAGLNTKAFGPAIRTLLAAERAAACQIKKGRKKYDAFKPTQHTANQTSRTHPDSPGLNKMSPGGNEEPDSPYVIGSPSPTAIPTHEISEPDCNPLLSGKPGGFGVA